MAKFVRCWLALGLGLALGCGDSDGGEPDAAAEQDAGHDAGKKPIVRVDSGSPEPEPVMFMCEATECTVPELDISTLNLPPIMGFEITPELIADMGYAPMGCCVDETKCGVTQEMLFGGGFCAEQDQPGEPDTECPSESASVMGLITIPLEGCCRPDTKCGVNLDLIGVGCVERTQAAMIEIMGMTLPDAGMIEEITCVPGAEMSDAGAP
jgi:hypothetical protein